MNAIETQGLTKYYGKTRGVVGLDLAVEEGEFFGFIGPNGAGKSTTIRALLGLIAPSAGTARILGQTLDRRRTALADVGYMPSEAAFWRGMRVGEAIRYSAALRGRACGAQAARLCERLCLDTGRRIDALSLGNRKKVAIVCALQHRPRLCILDEPTSGLDPLMQREFFAILRERNAEGATIFLSSHVLSEVQRYCRRAAVIREGRLLLCEEMGRLGHTGAKRVSLRGAQPPALAGVTDVQACGDTVSFLYSGAADALLRALAPLAPRDVTITEPDLEEILLHYYGEATGA